MVYYKKNIAIKRHEWELAGTVVVDNTGDFVDKCPNAEDVGNEMAVNVVDEIEVGVNAKDVLILDGFNKAGHDEVRDRDGGTNAKSFWGGALSVFLGSFHVAF